MTFPYQQEFFQSRLPLHFIFETLAFVVGMRVYFYCRKKTTDPISDDNRLWILLGAVVGALIGSRLVALLEQPLAIATQSWLEMLQNKTIAGGLLGGLFGVELLKKIIGEKKASGDLYVVPIIVALIIGRIGCFSMGVREPIYGLETNFFMGMDLGDGKLRHPLALYEMLYLGALLLFFAKIKHKSLPNGDRFKIFMLLYFGFRFGMECLKPYQPLFLNLSSIQWSAVIIFLYYHRFLRRLIPYA